MMTHPDPHKIENVAGAGAASQSRMMLSGAPSDESIPIRRTAENLVYRNEFIAVYDDDVMFLGGRLGNYVRVVESDGKPGVAMLAIARGSAALVRTYRYAVGSWEWAIPRGFAHGDDPEASARAELTEELGQGPQALIELAKVSPNSGLLAGFVHLFIASYFDPPSGPTDRGEIAEVRWLPVSALFSEIAAGQITDVFTLAAVACGVSRGML